MKKEIDYAKIDKISNRYIEDEYDINALVGKIMEDFNVELDIKDALKVAIREAFKLGYQTAKEQNKK